MSEELTNALEVGLLQLREAIHESEAVTITILEELDRIRVSEDDKEGRQAIGRIMESCSIQDIVGQRMNKVLVLLELLVEHQPRLGLNDTKTERLRNVEKGPRTKDAKLEERGLEQHQVDQHFANKKTMAELARVVEENQGSISVLLVDDEPLVRKIVSSAFEEIPGIKIHEAEDGTSALDALTESDMDVVFMDILMRPTDGLEALRAIRMGQDGVRHDTPVVMLTSVNDDTAAQAAIDLDANGFIVKPTPRKALLEYLALVLTKRQPMKSSKEYERIKTPSELTGAVLAVIDDSSDIPASAKAENSDATDT